MTARVAPAGREPWLRAATIAAAAIGAAFLLIVAVNVWTTPGDEHAYWLAAERLLDGRPLYDFAATIVTPHAYLYPPPLAQILVPVVAVVPAGAFMLLWTGGMLVCLWWLAGRNVIRGLALVAFPPVAGELWLRNVHLFLAVLVVLGLRAWPGFHAVGAAIKIAPALALPYLAASGAWRRFSIVLAAGGAMLIVSWALSPSAWAQYVQFVFAQDPLVQSSFLPVPFVLRAMVALTLALVAGRLPRRAGEPLFVIAFVIGLPSLWLIGLSALVALVPVLSGPVSPDRSLGSQPVGPDGRLSPGYVAGTLGSEATTSRPSS